MSDTKITLAELRHVAKLARIYLTETQESIFLPQLESILEYFDILKQADTSSAKPTYQVTGLKNVTRKDVVDVSRMFTQQQALANAKQQQNGYFVTSATIHKNAS